MRDNQLAGLGDDDVPSVLWLEQQGDAVCALAALRARGATDIEMGEALAARLALHVAYAMALPAANLDRILELASRQLRVRLVALRPGAFPSLGPQA